MTKNGPPQYLFDFEALLHAYDPGVLAVLSPRDLYGRADETLLSVLKEDSRFERKPTGYCGEQLGEYICMWANTPPDGGLIAIGIGDKGKTAGWHGNHSKLNDAELAASIYVPGTKCQAKRVPISRDGGEADFVLLLYIEYDEHRVIRTSKGDVFARRGDQKHKLNDAEIRALQHDKNEVSFEQEPCVLEWPDEFDMKLVRLFTAAIRKIRPELADRPDSEILVLRCLGRTKDSRFVPNYACALLFAKNIVATVPGCKVRFLRYDGEYEGVGERYNAVKDEWIEGNVLDLIGGTEKVVDSQLRSFSRMKDGKFSVTAEYPKVAWFEAIVNACVHRAYGNGFQNMDIFVKMFDDRLTIESPGPFPPFVTPENIYSMHAPRNPKLIEALYYLALTRCATEGTRRMRQTMREMDLADPEFEQKQVGGAIVRVTLRNGIKHRKAWVVAEVSELIGSLVASKLSQDQKSIVNFAAERGCISVSDAQRLTQKTWPAAKKMLVDLVASEIMRHRRRTDLKVDPQARFELNRPEDKDNEEGTKDRS